jgi:hypothetical protein
VADYNARQPANRVDKLVRVVDQRWLQDLLALQQQQRSPQRWLPETAYLVDLPTSEDTIPGGSIDHGACSTHSANSTAASCADKQRREEEQQQREQLRQQQRRVYFNDVRFEELPSLQKATTKRGDHQKQHGAPFAGSVFYICGFRDLRVGDYLARCVALGGGLRSPVFTAAVTTVVIGAHADPRSLQMIRSRPMATPTAVNVCFLLQALRHCGILGSEPSQIETDFVDIGPLLAKAKRVPSLAASAGGGGRDSGASRGGTFNTSGGSVLEHTAHVTPTSKIVNQRYLRNISNVVAQFSRPSTSAASTWKPQKPTGASGSTGSVNASASTASALTLPAKRKFGL